MMIKQVNGLRKNIIIFFSCAAIFSACSVVRQSSPQTTPVHTLKYIGGYQVPYNFKYKGTTVGGLSGIDYDRVNNVYYLICDDRSNENPARFYTAKISFDEKGIDSVEFIHVTTLLQKNGTPFPSSKKDPAHSPDPEGIRYNPVTDALVWTSEGERIVKKDTILEQPAITVIDKEGRYRDTFPLPMQTHMYATERGLRQNSVFEGLTFGNNFKTMWVSVEEPLYDDGPRAGLQDAAAYTRIIKYDVAGKQPVAQYAYRLEPVAHPPNPANEFIINGIPDILSIGGNKLLVIERSFSTGVAGCSVRLYLTDLSKASDIAGVTSLKQQPTLHPASKKLLLNMDDLGIYIDNIEGVTFGPDLPNGHRTLIFVSDDNFSSTQKTQFLLFEVN